MALVPAAPPHKMRIPNTSNNLKGDWMDGIDRQIFPFVEYPGYSDRYPTKSGLTLTINQENEIRKVCRILFQAFVKTVIIFQHCPDQFMESMEIPDSMIPYLCTENPLHLPAWLSRFDFVLDKNKNLHMVEINADTPCALVEAYYANQIFCDYYHLKNVNENCYIQLEDYLLSVYEKVYQGSQKALSASHPFIFTCFEDYPEDYATTLFLLKTMRQALRSSKYPVSSLDFCSLYQLKVNMETGDIVLPDTRTAGALYRLHPLEILVEEKSDDEERLPIGLKMLDGYKGNRFAMFNPPEAIIMQSKAFQALVWMLAYYPAAAKIYTPEEIQTIRTYMLPTYFSREDWLNNRTEVNSQWITKPIWGREGHGIKIVDENEKIYAEKVPDWDTIRKKSIHSIYQQFVDQPLYQAETDNGIQDGYLTLSCFMLGETPSALYSRFSPQPIAGTEAYFMPLAEKD